MTRGNKEMMCDAENRQPVQYQYDKIDSMSPSSNIDILHLNCFHGYDFGV